MLNKARDENQSCRQNETGQRPKCIINVFHGTVIIYDFEASHTKRH